MRIINCSLVLLLWCASFALASREATTAAKIADLQVVDCLLPGQVRRLGNSTYVTPRRPALTTAADCRLRGGEYVAYDRADYKTALNVWLAAAEAGEAEAQVNVGEIFERGHGGTPNYETAAFWYRKAAEQGNSRGLYNLGTLYEQGLGVEKNKLEALNLYRQAWGLPDDDIIFQSAAHEQQQALREQLQQQIKQKDTQIQLLNQQVQQLEKQLSASGNNELESQLKQLRDWISELESQRSSARQDFEALPVFRKPNSTKDVLLKAPTPTKKQHKKFGKYFALVVGNQGYQRMTPLNTPHNDATRVAKLLENQYGFSVRLLLDASNVEVMQAVNELDEMVGENDNLLIYYAGHGSRIRTGELESGYWLPINADPPPTDTFWVSNEFVTRHLARLKAKRVLVVADSCYAGLLSSAPGYLFLGDNQTYNQQYIQYKLDRKARLLLASGSDKPVLDNAGAGHSVFARSFISTLQNNQKIMAAPELFIKLKDQVQNDAQKVGVEQKPEFKAIKGAGHEVGDFFFVPI